MKSQRNIAEYYKFVMPSCFSKKGAYIQARMNAIVFESRRLSDTTRAYKNDRIMKYGYSELGFFIWPAKY